MCIQSYESVRKRNNMCTLMIQLEKVKKVKVK
jgi:hypothetical protein